MKQSKSNVQLVYLMGTTMLVLCLVPIIDGLQDRRVCDVDGLCNGNEDESRFYSDKRVDRLDQDQEQRLLLFNRAERRFDRHDLERADERRFDTRDERLSRYERLSHKRTETDQHRNDRQSENAGERFVAHRESETDRNSEERSDENRAREERMRERFDTRFEDRRVNDERYQSRNDDRRVRQERFDVRRERDAQEEVRDERKNRLNHDLERRERSESRERIEGRLEERRERVDQVNDRLERNERMARETTRDGKRETRERIGDGIIREDAADVEERRVREQTRDVDDREDSRMARTDDRREQSDRRNRQENSRIDGRERHMSDRRERIMEDVRLERQERLDQGRMDRDVRKLVDGRLGEDRIRVDRFVANEMPTKDNNSTPFLWNIVQGALIAFIGVQLMKKSELNGDWKPSKFTQLLKLRDSSIDCN